MCLSKWIRKRQLRFVRKLIYIQVTDDYNQSFFFSCVPAGSCNGAFCAENAICLFDDRQKVNYCYCPEGFIGDGVSACKSVPPPCNIRNNCGLYASCSPNYR